MDLTITNLREKEAIIERGLATFIEVGTALMEIKAEQLYLLDGYETFDAYCKTKWNFSASRANQLVRSAQAATNLGIEDEGVRDGYIQPLLSLDEESQKEAWAEMAENPSVSKARTLKKKYKVKEYGGPLWDAVDNYLITPTEAYEIMEILERLPDHLAKSIQEWGFTAKKIVSYDVLMKLMEIGFEFNEEIELNLITGYIEELPIIDLNLADIEKYHRQLIYWKIVNREEEAKTKQQAQVTIPLLSGIECATDRSQLAFMFPEGVYTPSQLGTIIEAQGLDVFMVVTYNKEQKPTIRGPRGKRVTPDQINGEKPEWIIDLAEKLSE